MAAIARQRRRCEQRHWIPRAAETKGMRPDCRPRNPWHSVLAGLAIIALSGCTVIEIADSDGAMRIERRLGFASITVQPPRDAVVARLRSFGLAHSPLGFTAGSAAHQLAVLGEDCRVVFWVEREQQLRALERLAATLSEVCIINPNQGDDQ
jgi:hypothetical protein